MKDPSENGFIVSRSSISAQVQTDASMHISVQNRAKIGRNCNVFFWSLASLNSNSKTSINSVRIARINDNGDISGEWMNLAGSFFNTDLRDTLSKLSHENASLGEGNGEQASANSGTWMFDSSENMLYAFFAPQQIAASESEEDGQKQSSTVTELVIDIDYTVSDAVMTYDDVGEMYWYYLSGGNKMPIWNASAVIQLPVPHGTTVEPGETVIAWGHGATGTVDVQSDGTIHYKAPYVAQGQYMMAHVIFPVSWLENISRETLQLHSGMRKAYAIEGEEDWTDTSTAHAVNSFTINAICVGICAIGLAAAIILFFKRGREDAPNENDLRAIAAMDSNQLRKRLQESVSPAVISRLTRNGRLSDADFTKSIEYLIGSSAITVSSNAGNISHAASAEKRTGAAAAACATADSVCAIANPMRTTMKYPHSDVAERVLNQRRAPNTLEAVRLHIGKNAKNSRLHPTEQATLKVLFEDIADGYPTLPLSDMHKFAKAEPARFVDLMEGWQSTLSCEMAEADVFDAKSAKLRRKMSIAATLYLVFGIALGIAFGSPVVAVCGIATSIVMAFVASKCAKRTSKGIELSLMSELLQTKEAVHEADATKAAPEASATEHDTAESGANEQATPAFPAAEFTKMLEDDLSEAYKRK